MFVHMPPYHHFSLLRRDIQVFVAKLIILSEGHLVRPLFIQSTWVVSIKG